MKKILQWAIGIIALVIVLIWVITTFFPEKLIPMMLDQQVQRQADLMAYGDELLNEKEGITVVTVGTASPIPGERVQTGTAVFVNGRFFMFDVGDGVVQKAENLGLPITRLDAIFITHWHSDHMMDLPSLISRSWVLGRENDIHLYGPDGLDTLNQAINQYLHIENQHRVDHHGPELMDISMARAIPHEFKSLPGGKELVYNQDGIKITAFDVDHEPIEPSVGYSIEYNGKKVVISGDTKKSENLIEIAQDADLLLHEVLLASLLQSMAEELKKIGNNRNATILHDVQDYHTTPSEVAEIAKQANVKELVLHHFVPAPDIRIIKNLYKRELSGFSGPIHFANDADIFVIK